jgi:hypothetical protein
MPNPPPKPVAICTGCGTFTIARPAIGQSCGTSVDPRTRRCKGVFLVVMPEDWRGCRQCGGKGRVERVRCGGRRVRFDRDADPEAVRRLITLLEGDHP